MRRALAVLGAAVLVAGCTSEPTPSPLPACPTEAPTAVSAQAALQDAALATVTVGGAVEGTFEIELLGEAAPIATANFVTLARCGYYNGITFHRVIPGFVIQAGDPQTRTNRGDFRGLGSGGPGYQFVIEEPPIDVPFAPYTVAMANAAPRVPDSNGSQFFITLADLDQRLRAVGTFSIFGRLTSGTDTVDEIAAVPVSDPQFGVPLTPVVIESIVISSGAGPSPDE
jgi:cyclophilin family peptidyl-prolyl cis-trans isomerase